MSTYIPLWCKTNFSFLEGASHPDELIESAHGYGLPGIAVTDRDGLYGIVRAHVKAKELDVQLLIGAQVTLDDASIIVLIAANKTGYQNLCQLLSKGRLRSPKGSSSVSHREVCCHAKGLIALWGGQNSALLRTEEPKHMACDFKDAFGNRLYAIACRHRRAEERRAERILIKRAKAFGLAIVAGYEVLYHILRRRPLQDILTCLRKKCTLGTAGQHIRPNAEHALKSSEAFFALFADRPQWAARTQEVASRCTYSLDQLSYCYPSEALPHGATSFQYLRKLTFEGARTRYHGQVPTDVRRQLERELALIDELNYPGYFLTMWDIVQFCRHNNILCQGRGSAANSAVCYCLGITAIDPVRMNLLFERFISKERAEPPDIDLDIEHERREEVIQHVYKKYGRHHAAMVAVVVRYRPKSAIRDVGRVLGLPEPRLDRLARLLSHFHGIGEEKLVRAGLSLHTPVHKHLLRLSQEIIDFPRHLSIHPGGFLLGHEPVSHIVPIENGTMPKRTVIQWDKDDVEALGLFKVDLLGLGALTHLHRCFDLLKTYQGTTMTMATIPSEDPQTFDMICQGKTVGVFQIESRAQMAMLPRLKPRCFYDLVIEVSIVRPGPITGGMVHPYLSRRRGEETVTYPHPSLEPVLKKTLGVPLFQEQVMKLAVVAADYTPGEADQLRRDMAAWRKHGQIERHRELLISRMAKKGIAQEFAERVFDQIRGFGEYGFPESHAASFALISYATAWMRCHYPAEFICGLLNSQPMGFYTPATIVEDAQRMGLQIKPTDVTRSHWDCTLEPLSRAYQKKSERRHQNKMLQKREDKKVPSRFAVRMGLRFVKGLGQSDVKKMIAARMEYPFKSLAEFVRRTDLDAGALKGLAKAGAFAAFGLSRRQALWEVGGLVKDREDSMKIPRRASTISFQPLSPSEIIKWDYNASAHSTNGHPLEPIRPRLQAMGLPTARKLSTLRDGQVVRYVGMVICRQRPGSAAGVVFMTLEDETGFANLVLWKDVFKKHEIIAKTVSFLGVTGNVQNQSGVTHLIAHYLWAPKFNPDPPLAGSRDFH
jgi:error-prone DNA polymerase